MGVDDISDGKRHMECACDLAGDEERIISLGLAATPEGGNGFFCAVDIDRTEHLAIHVDVAEGNAKIRRLDRILGHAHL